MKATVLLVTAYSKHVVEMLRGMKIKIRCQWLVPVFLCLSLIACGDNNSKESNSAAHGTNNSPVDLVIPAEQQRQGDPVAGRKALITEPIVSCGVPLSAVQQIESDPSLALHERDGDAAQLPYFSNLIENDKGVKLVASNCLTCHGAPLFGEVVFGLGNEFLDFTQNPSIPVDQIGTLVTGENETAAWEKYADRVAAIAPYMQTAVAGVNPANNLTFALMAHRDPKNMQWHTEPLITPPKTDVPPVSVPPWWRMKKKNAMFWMGEGRGDHATIMMTAAILCSDSLEEVAQLDSIAADVRAYIESIEAPAYPFDVNEALAAEGQAIFENTCSTCHGTYGEKPTYPNRIVDIAVVGTDSTLIDYAFGEGQAYVNWFNNSPFGAGAQAQPSRGYVPPPLDGIWATAPFLHNGSVPTIRAVLDSSKRPSLWHHLNVSNIEQSDYDQENLGWHFSPVNADADLQELSVDKQWVYDTRRKGYANTGHQFGDALTGAQRDAVIEYLKTL